MYEISFQVHELYCAPQIASLEILLIITNQIQYVLKMAGIYLKLRIELELFVTQPS